MGGASIGTSQFVLVLLDLLAKLHSQFAANSRNHFLPRPFSVAARRIVFGRIEVRNIAKFQLSACASIPTVTRGLGKFVSLIERLDLLCNILESVRHLFGLLRHLFEICTRSSAHSLACRLTRPPGDSPPGSRFRPPFLLSAVFQCLNIS
ncbi:hypothetical protein [Simplicispira suum]|uniref:hypothetical protein n=1 Tax=Simplicispira suum TaxID=2109915 RepID=UPI001FE659DD|nr:hypothetical protein [Simplicispira suum]